MHIALFNIPAYGHVTPTLAVVTELVRRGHRVSYAVTEEFASQVRATGARLVPYTTTLPSATRAEDWPWDDPVAMASIALDEAVAILPGQQAAFDGDRPDLVLHDFGALTARRLAHRWNVPAVCLASTHVSGADAAERAQSLENMEIWLADDPRWTEHRRKFREFLDEGGLDLSIDDYTGLPERCLVPIPREFQVNGEAVDARYTFVGPCIGDREFQGEWAEPDAGRPLLLVALGSAGSKQPEFYRRCVEAFGNTPWQVVMSTGGLAPDALGPLPANVQAYPSVPQLRVLARANAFITHAGMGSALEAMYHEVPMVAVPQVNDQFVNAARIEELGLGVHVPLDEATPVELRKAVDDIAGDLGIAERLAAMRRSIDAAGGTRAAADFIERLLP
ncbi:macrolide family glycosyltransferase [Streptomyces sp. NPDC051994]|uniref:macrolide family glycosyltransferase n=1 Tax=unclassified Streptomyces TaxID=2593676 RepID=UPI00343C12C5